MFLQFFSGWKDQDLWLEHCEKQGVEGYWADFYEEEALRLWKWRWAFTTWREGLKDQSKYWCLGFEGVAWDEMFSLSLIWHLASLQDGDPTFLCWNHGCVHTTFFVEESGSEPGNAAEWSPWHDTQDLANVSAVRACVDGVSAGTLPSASVFSHRMNILRG